MEENWTKIIKPQTGLLALDLKEVWRYRDLCYMFVRRDLVVKYKQTILGPLWYIIQPLITTVVFTVVFGKIAKISTDGVPHILFYLSGLVCWDYFSTTLNSISDTFSANQGIFGKVYFPRMVVPISTLFSNFIKLIINLITFFAFYSYYYFKGIELNMTWFMLLIPFLIILTACLSLGLGIILSSMTTKYRDVRMFMAFAVNLLMYATPIIYSLGNVPAPYNKFLCVNPMTGIIYTFKYAFFGGGVYQWYYIIYSVIATAVILFIGLVIFSSVEKNFIDTV